MKAVRIHEFGGADKLEYEEADKPEPKRGQVLVRVRGAGVGVWEIDIREGGWKGYIDYPLPLIIGTDMSGTVEAVGPGVRDFQVGQDVYGVADMTQSGAYAQFAVTSHNSLAPKPRALNHIEAASVPVSAVTAWLMLYDLGRLRPGQRVLIHGGAGAVGSYAIQLAKLKDAYVIATASKDDRRFVKALGADEFIDYHSENFEEMVDDIDLVIDLVGGKTKRKSFNVLKRGGTLVTAPEPVSEMDKKRAKVKGVRIKFVECVPTKELLKKVGMLIDEGKLKTNVGNVVPLAKAKHAQELIEGHRAKRGKVVLKVA